MHSKVRPDRLLDTGRVLVLVIVGHPHAGTAFWKRRLERYEPVLHALRVVCFALTEQQYYDASEVIATHKHSKRCLPLRSFQVEELVTRLARE